MTLIASWLNFESNLSPTIWTVGDTMISDSNGTMTLEGSKVLELPVRCKDLSTPNQKLYFQGQLGFAYAGSSLRALNCYATLSTVLTNLGGTTQGNELPDAFSILNVAKDILKLYQIRDSVCELCIYGVCPKTKSLFIGTVKPILNSLPMDFEIELIPNNGTDVSYVLLGAHKNDAARIIDEELDKVKGTRDHRYWRTPARALHNIIKEHRYDDVGGGLQLNYVNLGRFEMTSSFVDSNMKYRNIDMFEDLSGRVGDCLIAINGIDFL